MGIGKHFGLSTDKANEHKKERNYKKIPWNLCQCSGSSQIPIQDDLNYHQFLSLYKLDRRGSRTVLIIFNTENEKEEVKDLDDKINLDSSTCITQLPNGELFCYGGYDYRKTLIIDRSYGVRMLPYGTPCDYSSALYFENNIYCFGGYKFEKVNLSRKFDLKNNRWINLALLPENDYNCHSVIFNGNILISGLYSRNLWLYSIEIDSFSIISYNFEFRERKLLINVERLYLIELAHSGIIYESEDEYHLEPISKSGEFIIGGQIYCLYNKEKIYISTRSGYYQFDLKKKVMHQIM